MNLIFFDIDGTLLISQGAGGRSITRVMKTTFQVKEEIARIEIHGQTDRGIATQLFSAHGVEDSDENWSLFKSSYLAVLDDELVNSDGELLPGIPPLLDQLHSNERVELALLTGNLEIGAFKKVKHFGVEKYFTWGGFGDRQRDRSDLAREAMQAAEQKVNLQNVDKIFVIGDTPNDIRCGKAIDAITVAVATGGHSAEQLAAHHPDHLFSDLSDTEQIAELLA